MIVGLWLAGADGGWAEVGLSDRLSARSIAQFSVTNMLDIIPFRELYLLDVGFIAYNCEALN